MTLGIGLPAKSYFTIDRGRLAQKLEKGSPGNESRGEGFALVSVTHRDRFERERIPGSINIPHDEIREFARRFSRSKEIVLYAASRRCDAASAVARALASEGFERVIVFEGGLEEWRDAGHPLAGTAHA